MKRLILLTLFVLVFFFVAFYFFYSEGYRGKRDRSTASTSNSILTTKDEFELGARSNIDSTSYAGQIVISNKSLIDQNIDLWAWYSADNSRVTATTNAGDAYKIIDGDSGTKWSGASIGSYWTLDLGYTRAITNRVIYWTTDYYRFYSSIDGSSWTQSPVPPFNARYLKFTYVSSGIPTHGVSELSLTENSPATATHLSAPTQITNSNLYQWQTFTPTYTKPANTNISFRFRTSTDASTWTDWSASQTPSSGSAFDISSLVTSKTGDVGSETFYKYIQVETTLTSTDGVSTPTLSDYTVNYHTNVPPSAPTGLTAVVGS